MKNDTSMRLFPLLGLLLVLAFSSCQTSNNKQPDDNADQPDKDGFVRIFNGKNLEGWEGDSTYWRVEDGNLVGEITPSTLLERNSFIIWRGGMPADFELKVEYKVSKDGNSGINYRSEEVPDVPHALRGYQADLDGAQRYTGSNYEERKRTTLASRGEQVVLETPYTLPEADAAAEADSLKAYIKSNRWTRAKVVESLGHIDSLKQHIKEEDWNEYHLVVKGNRLQHYVNGVLMSDVTDNDTLNRKTKGLLGVQVHVGPPMTIAYRNFRLKEL
jgi:hypothetical protein